MCVQARQSSPVHSAQLAPLPGPQGLPAAPPPGGPPAVPVAVQAGTQGAAQEEGFSKGSWQAAAGLLMPCRLQPIVQQHQCLLLSSSR